MVSIRDGIRAMVDALDPADLVKLADLIKLTAETAKLFSDTMRSGNGRVSKITSLAQQIEDLAIELRRAGEELITEDGSNAQDLGAAQMTVRQHRRHPSPHHPKLRPRRRPRLIRRPRPPRSEMNVPHLSIPGRPRSASLQSARKHCEDGVHPGLRPVTIGEAGEAVGAPPRAFEHSIRTTT